MRLHTPRVIIIGAGLAALSAALRLAPRPVLLISPEPLGAGASSAWAQGGVAAAIGAGDSAESHAADTIRAGAGTVDPAVAALVTQVRAHDLTDLPRQLRRLQRMSDQLGMVSLGLVAADARICLDQVDATAFSAVWARLLRVAERSLAGDKDLLDQTV